MYSFSSLYEYHWRIFTEAVAWRCSIKKVFLEDPQENTSARVAFLIKLQPEAIKLQAEACNFIEKEILAQVFSCEFCKIYKNSFSYRTPPVAASVFTGVGNAMKPVYIRLHHYRRKCFLCRGEKFSRVDLHHMK